ncbi:hypothetical protein Taro_025075 [Colocasia esculenta]|uniref:Conserved oligomeric Golgi complex subunit 1 n=1 Tax=Colocasia esculenta TaxID=4460 RepID=A0A843VD63_COLES|nr:hypothetical protein [Colocasia esculenta]
MRVASRPPAEAAAAAMSTRDAESLFRTKKVAEIRAVEAATKREIEEKKEELRQLVGKSYRDLIDSADTIVLMKTSCESISGNLGAIDAAIRSLSALADAGGSPVAGGVNPARARVYGIACRVKYLVDTSENIWGCLDESMFVEASGRYLRARVVHGLITGGENAGREVLAKFPMLRQLWANVGGLKNQISRMSRERLMERGLAVGAYADALAAVAIIDGLDPKMALSLFLDSRRSWISQKLGTFSPGASPDADSLSSVLCDVARIIRSTLGQVGELFLHLLNDLPLFYKTVLGSPPGTQLFGGIPNPEEEVKQWKLHREKLESVMVILDPDYVAQSSSSWLKSCCAHVFGTVTNKRDLTNSVGSGEGLARAEKLIREILDCREDLEGSLEQWLKNVFGSDVESPWNQIRSLILKDQKDILEDMLEDAFVERMKEIVSLRFEELNRVIDVKESVQSIVVDPGEDDDFSAYLKKPSTGGGVWFSDPGLKKAGLGFGFKQSVDENDFRNCLNAYLGPEVSRIRDALDNNCGLILEDLLCFIDSNNSTTRLQELAPFLQDKCFTTMSDLLKQLEDELGQQSSSLGNKNREHNSQPPSIIVKRSLFIGRLLFAFRNHSSHIPLILGSPRQWVKETSSSAFSNLQVSLSKHSKMAFSPSGPYSAQRQTDTPMSPRRQSFDNSRRQTISAAVTLFPMDDSVKPKLDSLMKTLRDLCVKAHSLWISWVSEGLATILSEDLGKDDALSLTTSLRGWEVTMIKQDESSEGPLEMKIALPSMPSLYVTSFLFQACQEVHRVGGHVLDKSILQMFAWRLLEKNELGSCIIDRDLGFIYFVLQFVVIYEDFLSTAENQKFEVSEKGILQILLDLRFAADVLSGGKDSTFHGSDANVREDSSKIEITKPPFRRKQSQFQPDSALSARVVRLINELSQRLDPIDWATYEPYLWENEQQSYKRYAVLFGFLVQLNRMYTDVVQKLPTKSNTESNILRCSTIPRFKYLPISGPIQSAKGAARSPLPTFPDDGSRSPWKAYANGERSPKSEFDDTLGFGVATPLFKSFMTQVGSKFGESTSRLGSMLTDAQVGKLKDRSAAAMSTFGDMLPVSGVGLLSSFTTGAAREF